MALMPGQMQQQQQQQAVVGVKGDMAPVFQQLSLGSLRTRTQDLYASIGRILHAFHSNPSTKWPEVLSQFAMVNVELLNLVEDIKPVTKMYVVYPKFVNAENSQMLPIMLSTKLLPEMESEEEAIKEEILAGISSLPASAQTERLQRQIEMVRSACDSAEKVITEARKVYGLATRQGPVQLPTLDKGHASRVAEQEKVLRAATNYGEGLRIPADQLQPAMLPQHLSASFPAAGDGRGSSYLGTDAGYLKATMPNLPPSGLRSAAQQQASIPQLQSRVQTPTQSAGGTGLSAASPSQMSFMVNSPKSAGSIFNAPSPQQSQQPSQQAAAALLQRSKAQQHQHQLLHRQTQLQQLHQQMRRPATPPVGQSQLGIQPQAQAAQPLVQQQKQQQLQQLQQHQQQQQQSQNRLPQQYSHQQQTPYLQQQQQLQQDRQAMHHLHHTQQHQNLQQQLQSAQLQQNQGGLQGNQVRGQLGQPVSIYGAGNQSNLSPNVMASMSQPMQSQQNLLQQRLQQLQQQGNLGSNQVLANQAQQNVPSMLSDSLYNMGVAGAGVGVGAGAQLTQNSQSLGVTMQQQQLGQPNYITMYNNPTQSSFMQNRQQQPPS